MKGDAARDSLVAKARAFLPANVNLVNEIELLPDRPAQLVAKKDQDRISLEWSIALLERFRDSVEVIERWECGG